MFTIAQIESAHSKVKSGADFPNYISDIKLLGVKGFTTYVSDSHTVYQSADGREIRSEGKYEPMTIAANSDIPHFEAQLKAHQQGKTDYFTFCNDCAETGIEKWVVDLDNMTCIYYDKAGKEILVEPIPQA